MNYITTCKYCGDSKLRANYLYTSSGEAIKLVCSSFLDTDGLPADTFGDRKPKPGDEIELRCAMCGNASQLDQYEVPDVDKVVAPDVDALRKDISAMLDTARFAPRPPVVEPKQETTPCRVCKGNCDCTAEEGNDSLCHCDECEGCNACECCCTCNNGDEEPANDEPTGDDEQGLDFDHDENDLRQEIVRDMEEGPRWDNLCNRIAEKLDREAPENSFYLLVDWENRRYETSLNSHRLARKFLDLRSGEAEIFVQSPRNDFTALAASWHERILHIETE